MLAYILLRTCSLNLKTIVFSFMFTYLCMNSLHFKLKKAVVLYSHIFSYAWENTVSREGYFYKEELITLEDFISLRMDF